ncbi:MAG: 30S ribosome-binding factor RbfA [candidate division WOR-3 bacterium]
MPYRERKVANVIKDAVAQIVLQELADPNIGFVTITGAKITSDYKKAFIYFSVIGDEEKQQETLRRLNHAAGYVRHLLKQKVILKTMPEIHFEIDTLLQAEQKIGSILDDLHKKSDSE